VTRRAPAKHDVCLGLGSNIGDRRAHIEAALQEIAKIGENLAASDLYETAPVGYLDQPDFLNAACRFTTALTPAELLARIRKVEASRGRQRAIPNGPRTLDIDILLYDDLVIDTPELQIPHPRMHERAFVLVPLAEIARDLTHPVFRKTMGELLDGLGVSEGIRLQKSGRG